VNKTLVVAAHSWNLYSSKRRSEYRFPNGLSDYDLAVEVSTAMFLPRWVSFASGAPGSRPAIIPNVKVQYSVDQYCLFGQLWRIRFLLCTVRYNRWSWLACVSLRWIFHGVDRDDTSYESAGNNRRHYGT